MLLKRSILRVKRVMETPAKCSRLTVLKGEKQNFAFNVKKIAKKNSNVKMESTKQKGTKKGRVCKRLKLI